MNRPSRTRGFTLLEMSIVVVIIALLVAGVFVGRELIFAAQIKKQISQIQSYNTATNAFIQKYNCMPGDCTDAVRYGLGQTSGPGANGNGNGTVDVIPTNSYNTFTGGGESLNFWYHLSQAKMIEGAYFGETNMAFAYVEPGAFMGEYRFTPPLALPGQGTGMTSFGQNKQGGVVIVPVGKLHPTPGYHDLTTLFNLPRRNAWFLTANLSSAGVDTYVGVYFASTLYAIDSKMDDGLPRQGNMRVIGSNLFGWDSSYGNQAPACYTLPVGPNSTYDLSVVTGRPNDPNATCAPLILVDFEQ